MITKRQRFKAFQGHFSYFTEFFPKEVMQVILHGSAPRHTQTPRLFPCGRYSEPADRGQPEWAPSTAALSPEE